MKLAMTLLVRDEADIIGEHLTFHLNAGVDLVLVTDHRSVDGTSDVLDAYARDGSVRVEENGGLEGVTEGLDSRGFLQVRTAQGLRTVLSGTVRLK